MRPLSRTLLYRSSHLTLMYGTLTEYLLRSSLLCGMKADKKPAYRMQLFFVANKDLKSTSRQMNFQRAIETGVDEWGFWENYGQRRSGEYILTERGYENAIGVFGEVVPLYKPTRATDYDCEIRGEVEGTKIQIVSKGKRSDILIDGAKTTTAKEACRILDARHHLGLSDSGGSAVKMLYDLGVDRGFEFVWKGPRASPGAV